MPFEGAPARQIFPRRGNLSFYASRMSDVRSSPMRLTTYVNFAGTCAEAFRYYEQHLAGTIVFMMKHGESPQPTQLGPEWKDAVLHARIDLGGTALLGADIPKAEPMRSAY